MSSITAGGGKATGGRRRLLWLMAILVSPLALFFAARGVLAAANVFLERRYPPPGQMISVGGHRLHLFCQGKGSPTIVIEPGLGVDWVAWAPVVEDLVTSAEVCVYDRAGYGWSEAGPMPRTAGQSAEELHQLLSSRPGPIVLVGHSFGGYIARVYAARFAGAVQGVVLVDPSERDPAQVPTPASATDPRPRPWSVGRVIDLLPPLGWERVKRLYHGESALSERRRKLPAGFRHRIVVASSLDQLVAEQSERDSSLPSQEQVRAEPFPRHVPLVVITPASTSETHRELHRQIAEASDQGSQVLADNSGHMVHIDRPDLIVSAVRGVLSRSDRSLR